MAQHMFAANLAPAGCSNSSSSTVATTTTTTSVSTAVAPKAPRVVHAYVEPTSLPISAVASGASTTPVGAVATATTGSVAASSSTCPPIVVTAITVTSAPHVSPGVAISSDWHWVNGVLVSAAPHHLDGREVSCERNGRRLGGEVMQVSAKGQRFTVEWYDGTTEKLSERAVKAMLLPPPRVIDLSYLRSCKKASVNLRHETPVGPQHQAELPPMPSDSTVDEKRKRARDSSPHARDTADVLVSSADPDGCAETAEEREGEAEVKRARLGGEAEGER